MAGDVFHFCEIYFFFKWPGHCTGLGIIVSSVAAHAFFMALCDIEIFAITFINSVSCHWALME